MLIRSSQFDPRNPLKTTPKKRLFLTFLQKTLFSKILKFPKFKNLKRAQNLISKFERNLEISQIFESFWVDLKVFRGSIGGNFGRFLLFRTRREKWYKNYLKLKIKVQKILVCFFALFLTCFWHKKSQFLDRFRGSNLGDFGTILKRGMNSTKWYQNRRNSTPRTHLKRAFFRAKN